MSPTLTIHIMTIKKIKRNLKQVHRKETLCGTPDGLLFEGGFLIAVEFVLE